MTLRRMTLTVVAALMVLPAAASAEDQHSDNMSLVKNLPYQVREDLGQSISYGTDVEFATIGGKRYAMAGSELNGLQIVDITTPAKAKIASVYDCAVSQGDTQVFKRGKRTYVTYTNDYEDTEQTAGTLCYRQAEAKGFDAVDEEGVARLGTFVVDVTSVGKPSVATFVPIDRGSHNMTVHPSGDFLYNSNSDLMGIGGAPAIEIFDIRDFSDPKPAETPSVSLTPFPGLGADSHDITFNAEGTRAYSAALSHGVILNTEDPGNPTIVSEFDSEAINVWHQSDPFTIRDENGEVVREFLLVEDEVAGAAGPGVCPTGGVHVFDISNESQPIPVGYWNIDDVAFRDALDTCTAHVFDIHEDEQVMTIAYYMGGVRVVDLSGLATAPIGIGQGDQGIGGAMKEIGFYITEDANTWSAKTPVIEPDGSFYLYGNDINRGLDVYRFEAGEAESENPGTFLSAEAAEQSLPTSGLDLTTEEGREEARVFCLLPRDRG